MSDQGNLFGKPPVALPAYEELKVSPDTRTLPLNFDGYEDEPPLFPITGRLHEVTGARDESVANEDSMIEGAAHAVLAGLRRVPVRLWAKAWQRAGELAKEGGDL